VNVVIARATQRSIPSSMFAIIRTRWHTRPLSRRARRRSSSAPGSLRKKYAGIVYPPKIVHLPNHSTTSGDHYKRGASIDGGDEAVRNGAAPDDLFAALLYDYSVTR
jgi:hypothetical protein